MRVLVIAALVWVGTLDQGDVSDPPGTDHALVELVTVASAALPQQLDPPLVLASAVLHRSLSDAWRIDEGRGAPPVLGAVDPRERARRWRRRPRMRAAAESDH